jgi:dienelactone hydrolase
LQKAVYLKAAKTWEQPVTEVIISHTHKSGEDRAEIPAYIRFPKQKAPGKVPAVLLMTGLDGYRLDNTQRSEEFINRGWAADIVEIPGTADCPADPKNPESSERLWDSVLAWMEKEGRFDMGKVLLWGLSSGRYHAVGVAHTHEERLRGVIAQGVGVHEFFGKEWIEKADGHEYPFL